MAIRSEAHASDKSIHASVALKRSSVQGIKNEKRIIFRTPERAPKKRLSLCGEPFVKLTRLDYQVRFLWRLDFKRLRRLWLFILRRRFFLRFPIYKLCVEMIGLKKKSEMHLRVKGFFKSVTAHATPEPLTAKTEWRRGSRSRQNTGPIALRTIHRFSRLFWVRW